MTIIWRAGVFTSALGDYLFFGEKLKYFHILGLISITACILVLNSKNFDGSVETVHKKAEMEAWIPITCAVVFPVLLTWNNLLTKFMTKDKVGFNPSRVTYFTFGLMNIGILAISIPIWIRDKNFSPELFFVGFVGSCVNILGIICCQNAIAVGPIGPIMAIIALASIIFVF